MKAPAVAKLKMGLFLAAILLVAAILTYSFQMVDLIRNTTHRHLTILVEQYSEQVNTGDLQQALKTIERIDFPLILADAAGEPLFWKNVDIAPDNRTPAALENLRHRIREFDQAGNKPIPLQVGNGILQYFHYADDSLIQQLRWLTWLGIGSAILLVLVGYSGFRSVRAAEERALWIGLARETAHQLGTPLSGLMGWLEILRERYPDDTSVPEMERDLSRLRGVVNRFSAIGKEMVPVATDLAALVRDTVEYARNRIPTRSRNITLECHADEQVIVKLRPELIDWVLENLIRNAVEAISEGDGRISVSVVKERDKAVVTVVDNGGGMTPSQRRHAFRAGFTTKRKGWGVGLSLSKRIVEQEHHGSLVIVKSDKGGTTFRFELPLAVNESTTTTFNII